jgi:hypothetical protein
MAQTMRGRFEQRERYQHVRQCLHQRHAENALRRKDARKPSEKILVSWADPDSVFGLDKFKVYRPLYNVQLLRDLDSPLILAYDILAQVTEFGTVQRLMQFADYLTGRIPKTLLADSGYVSMRELVFYESCGITLYAPYKENDHSEVRKKHKTKQQTQIPKSEFTWLKDANTYRCPEGHLMRFFRRHVRSPSEQDIFTLFFVCPVERCKTCPRAKKCTTSRRRGRQVTRMENEELLEQLTQRMSTDEGKALYKLRCRTIELDFADMKEHRGIRRFSCRGSQRVRNETATAVLVHNLLYVYRATAERRVASTLGSNDNRNGNSPLACSA